MTEGSPMTQESSILDNWDFTWMIDLLKLGIFHDFTMFFWMLYQWPGKAIYHNGLPFEEDFDGLVEVSSDWKGKNGRETHDSYACMEEFLQLYIPLKPIFAILWSFNIAIENGDLQWVLQ